VARSGAALAHGGADGGLTGVGQPWCSGAPNTKGEGAKQRGDDTKLT
jgi:hypothetical protein